MKVIHTAFPLSILLTIPIHITRGQQSYNVIHSTRHVVQCTDSDTLSGWGVTKVSELLIKFITYILLDGCSHRVASLKLIFSYFAYCI